MIPQKVELAKPGLMSRLSGTTASFLGAALTVIFLTYFLLAAGTLFRQKLAEVLPGRAERAHVVEALAEIEVQMSRYLVLTTIINTVVGLLTWGALALLGMPNAALWGALAGVLNYIPYVGALATLIVIGVAGLVSFDQPKTALLAAGAFFVINMIESNLATPMILGAGCRSMRWRSSWACCSGDGSGALRGRCSPCRSRSWSRSSATM